MSIVDKKYDHIIAGGGLAGLSLAYRLSLESSYKDRHILILDKDKKQSNDRTWCFWTKNENDLYKDLVHHSWPQIRFASAQTDKSFQIAPYRYNMIRGIDFYTHTLNHLRAQNNVTFVTAQIEEITEETNKVLVRTNENLYTADYIFKSYPEKLDEENNHFVWQHFKGWIIETESPQFDPNEAMFMDFRVAQESETRFFYVLPVSKTKALIEFTIFSGQVSEPAFYDPFLRSYIKETLGIDSYKVEDEEIGAIPMTTEKFFTKKSDRIIPIGTNGGSVKASSGYAFTRIQRNTAHLLPYILANNLKDYTPIKNRFSFYDRIMLNAILSNKTTGLKVFENLFSKLSPQTIFKFLDEEGSFFNDLKIFTAPPTLPFLKAFFEEIKV